MKIALKYCIAFLFFLSIVLYTHASLASIKKFDEISIQSSAIQSDEIEKEENQIIILDNLFRA